MSEAYNYIIITMLIQSMAWSYLSVLSANSKQNPTEIQQNLPYPDYYKS